jgi:ABC-type bacteriocin/lantibiotic exporter with double-glycine peptidase domain
MPGAWPSTTALLASLWFALAPARKRRALQTAGVMLVAGAAEFATLLAVRGFLARLLGGGPERLVLESALVLAAAVVFMAMARLATLRMQDGLVLDFASDTSIAIFSRALHQPWLEHKRRRSAELFAALESMQRLVNTALGPMMLAIVNAGLAAVLLAYLLVLAPLVVAPILGLLAGGYWVIGRLTGALLRSSSHTSHELGLRRLKIVHETQAGFRDVVLGHSQRRVLDQFRGFEATYRKRQAQDRFVSMGPRHLVEMILMLAAVALACVLSRSPAGVAGSLPLIGVVALGLQRLMPLIHSCHTGWALFQAHSATIAHVLELARRPALPEQAPAVVALPFDDRIVLEGVGLRYDDRQAVLHDVDWTIRRGERVGIVGTSGGGKSSLLDIVMGLVEPTTGRVRVDGVALDSHALRWAWQMRISSVSQTLYLSDTSIREAIVDGDTGVDEPRLAQAIAGAQLADFLASLPQGAATRVGDSGLLLSGGQRQRIALARALYRQSSVLVLDEATSQLDPAAEAGILKTLETLDRSMTILVVTHRRAALQICDRIMELGDGALREVPPGERP